MSSKKIYDITPEQREILLWKEARRKQLRELYMKQSGHPTKSILFDTGIYRYAAAKTSFLTYHMPMALSYITRLGSVVTLIVLTGLTLKRRREDREHKYRTGQISYEVRRHRFC